MKPGTLRGDELILRCPYCGDSKNPDRGHLRVNLKKGVFHCYRCQYSGKIPLQFLLDLVTQDFPNFEITEKKIPFIIEGAATQRSSLLKRYKTLDNLHDAFYMYYPSSQGYFECGIYLRGPNKESQVYGTSGISWSGAPGPLVSDEKNPLWLVEGPYDVIRTDAVCLFGFFPLLKLKWFSGHFFYLVPDGDVWIKPDLLKILLSRIEYCFRKGLGFSGVVYLPGNADPDDNTEFEIIPPIYFRRKLWRKKSSLSKAQLALANLD